MDYLMYLESIFYSKYQNMEIYFTGTEYWNTRSSHRPLLVVLIAAVHSAVQAVADCLSHMWASPWVQYVF